MSDMPKTITVQQIADTLDHSLLRPDITVKELIEGCELAKEYRCVSVCVRPSDLPVVIRELRGSNVLPTTVVAFPHGVATTESKVFETRDVIEKGAVEVDMVLNIGRLLSGEYDYVQNDIAAVVEESHRHNAQLKVIFENYYLNDDLIIKCCEISKKAGADFIKTSTGYAGGGATIHDLKLMVKNANGMKVKAAGGVKTLDAALAVISTGTVRIGTRSSYEILSDAIKREKEGTLFLSDKGELDSGY